jgi:hypothetical protein
LGSWVSINLEKVHVFEENLSILVSKTLASFLISWEKAIEETSRNTATAVLLVNNDFM